MAQAGGGVQKTLTQQPPEIRGQLEIINKTAEVPPHPIVIHPRISQEVRDKITAAFMKMGESVAGKEIWLFGISRGHPQDVVFPHTGENPVRTCKSI